MLTGQLSNILEAREVNRELLAQAEVESGGLVECVLSSAAMAEAQGALFGEERARIDDDRARVDEGLAAIDEVIGPAAELDSAGAEGLEQLGALSALAAPDLSSLMGGEDSGLLGDAVAWVVDAAIEPMIEELTAGITSAIGDAGLLGADLGGVMDALAEMSAGLGDASGALAEREAANDQSAGDIDGLLASLPAQQEQLSALADSGAARADEYSAAAADEAEQIAALAALRDAASTERDRQVAANDGFIADYSDLFEQLEGSEEAA